MVILGTNNFLIWQVFCSHILYIWLFMFYAGANGHGEGKRVKNRLAVPHLIIFEWKNAFKT